MSEPTVLVLGVGSFTHSTMQILKESGAQVAAFLTRDYGHYGPKITGPVFSARDGHSPVSVYHTLRPDLIIPMSIDWYFADWGKELVRLGAPVLCPVGEAFRIESERFFAGQLCEHHGVPFPQFHTVSNRLDALKVMSADPRPYVLKNPYCSPFSPIHTIVCESVEETLGWLERLDYAEGVFMQEYLGRAEAGHFVMVADGQIKSLVTNQEYKRAYNGNLGPVAGAPLGGVVELDLEDRYGIRCALIDPLQPWLKESGFTGILQVTGIKRNDRWHVVEYNVRLGITSGAIILRMLNNPLEFLLDLAKGNMPRPQWKPELKIGCSLTLAGYGYPYVIPSVPKLPVRLQDPVECDLWWNEVDQVGEQLYMTWHDRPMMGHRIADLVAIGRDLNSAKASLYREIKKLHCLGSYYRTDIGESLWPPGTL